MILDVARDIEYCRQKSFKRLLEAHAKLSQSQPEQSGSRAAAMPYMHACGQSTERIAAERVMIVLGLDNTDWRLRDKVVLEISKVLQIERAALAAPDATGDEKLAATAAEILEVAYRAVYAERDRLAAELATEKWETEQLRCGLKRFSDDAIAMRAVVEAALTAASEPKATGA